LAALAVAAGTGLATGVTLVPAAAIHCVVSPPVVARPEPQAGPVDRAHTLIAPDVARFQATLLHVLEPQRPYLTATEYAIYGRGKKIRPLLLLLCARLIEAANPLPERVVKAAVSLEMLHVATLIHDDIIDKAPKRRGLVSVNAARGSDLALLIGDLQFINAVRCFASAVEAPQDMVLVQTVLDVGAMICSGEIDELMTNPSWTTRRLRERYFRTIDRKTAVLFQLACESGVTLMRARKRAIWKIGRYGRLVGRAFQMMDDLSDFASSDAEAGKLRGTDLMQRRPTLPIIYAMEELGAESAVSRIMAGEPGSPDDLGRAIGEVVGCRGFLRAYGEARAAIIEAVKCLEFFPESPLRAVLSDIAYHVVNRSLDTLESSVELTAGAEGPHSAAPHS
jgi:heptaprenyl diphosphate synthase